MNTVFIATSIDGYIADRNGGLEWLDLVPNPEGVDMGYDALIDRIDAIVMGRVSFETVLGFDIEWPYTKPVYVLSTSMKNIPDGYEGKVFLESGEPQVILDRLHRMGHKRLYIDGGTTIQRFLRADLIDEMIITTMPVLLGGGYPLFGDLHKPLHFTLENCEVFLNEVVQRHYVKNDQSRLSMSNPKKH